MEQTGKGAGGADGRGQVARVEDRGAAGAEIEGRDRQRHPARFDGARRHQRRDPLAKHLAAQEPPADPRIPEVGALEGEQLVGDGAGRHAGRPQSTDQGPGARAADPSRREPGLLERPEQAGVGVEAEEAGGQGQGEWRGGEALGQRQQRHRKSTPPGPFAAGTRG
jgi:hypothetical protein